VALHFSPGSIVVHGAQDPAGTAREVIRQLPRAIDRNDHGIRTTLRRKIGRT
jgi:hypothetical protein